MKAFSTGPCSLVKDRPKPLCSSFACRRFPWGRHRFTGVSLPRRPDANLWSVIRFDQGTRRFNYRVVGVAIHDGSVLLHRANHDAFWTLPGGRAEHGETAEQTIKREMVEELRTSVEVVRLLWLVENFFEYEGLNYHEVALYFLIRFPPGSAPLNAAACDAVDAAVPLRFKWFRVEPTQLANLPLVPAFLAKGLANVPISVVHVVQRDSVPSTIDSKQR
jgi:ADP-ribose pyrophosphatase YjhB (NUDIX family)